MGVFVAIVAATTSLPLAAETDPGRFIETFGNEALDVVKSPQLTKEQRRNKFRALFAEGFDLPTIGKFVLGRYWRRATPTQRNEYLEVFREFIVDTYAARFDTYAGKTFEVLQVVPLDHRDNIVNTHIFASDGTPFRVDYRVRKGHNGLKVVDVLVEGISLLNTHRSEIASVVNRDGIDGLITRLRKQTDQKTTAPD